MHYGFLPGRQPMDATEAIRILLRKVYECGGSIHIVSLGVAKAFDHIEAWAVEKALQAQDAPPWAIAAVLSALVDQHACPIVAGVSCDEPLVLGKGAR